MRMKGRWSLQRQLLAHDLLRWRECLNVGRAREDALGIFEQGRSVFAEVDAVKVEAPEQRCNSHIEHGEVVTQHELVFQEHRGQLG